MSRPYLAAISPDGKRVAVTADGQVVVYDILTGSVRELDVEGENVAWAPNNRRLAYDHNGNTHVYDLERGSPFDIGPGTRPSWAPDGEHVAARVGRNSIELINVSTRARSPMLVGASASVPRWSPNGEWMMYSVPGGGRWWSLSDAAMELRQLIVRNTKTGAEAVVGRSAKGNRGNYTWTTNPALCRRAP